MDALRLYYTLHLELDGNRHQIFLSHRPSNWISPFYHTTINQKNSQVLVRNFDVKSSKKTNVLW